MNDQEISKRALAIGGYTKWVRTGVFFFAPFWAAFTIATLFGLGTLIATAADVLTDVSNQDYATNIRWHALAFTAMLAAFGGLISAPFAIVRVFVAERQTRATEAQKDTAEQGLITDRLTKAVEQLGAEKTVKRIVDGEPQEWTEPNLEVRLGAIYALERIAQDSERDHSSILGVLCAYIRNSANGGGHTDAVQTNVTAKADRDNNYQEGDEYQKWIQKGVVIRPLRDDIRTSFKVLEKMGAIQGTSKASSEQRYLVDVSSANLKASDLYCLNLPFAKATGVRMEHANLSKANLRGADLSAVNLEDANLQASSLMYAKLEHCAFTGANCRSANFSKARKLRQSQVNSMFGDTNTKLPEGLTTP